jgi:hypothetical protein
MATGFASAGCGSVGAASVGFASTTGATGASPGATGATGVSAGVFAAATGFSTPPGAGAARRPIATTTHAAVPASTTSTGSAGRPVGVGTVLTLSAGFDQLVGSSPRASRGVVDVLPSGPDAPFGGPVPVDGAPLVAGDCGALLTAASPSRVA